MRLGIRVDCVTRTNRVSAVPPHSGDRRARAGWPAVAPQRGRRDHRDRDPPGGVLPRVARRAPRGDRRRPRASAGATSRPNPTARRRIACSRSRTATDRDGRRSRRERPVSCGGDRADLRHLDQRARQALQRHRCRRRRRPPRARGRRVRLPRAERRRQDHDDSDAARPDSPDARHRPRCSASRSRRAGRCWTVSARWWSGRRSIPTSPPSDNLRLLGFTRGIDRISPPNRGPGGPRPGRPRRGREAQGGPVLDRHAPAPRNRRRAAGPAGSGDPRRAGERARPERRRRRPEADPALARDGITVFLSSHVLPEVEQLCHRVAILQKGRIIAEGETQAMLRQGERLHVRFETPPRRSARRPILGDARGQSTTSMAGTPASSASVAGRGRGELGRWSQAGLYPAELYVKRQTLESVFIELTGDHDPAPTTRRPRRPVRRRRGAS